jgi:ParB family chromosome partitioning protein
MEQECTSPIEDGYLALADAPFDREDTALNPMAGACITCPRRSGYNTSLFADVQGDQCLDSTCYQTKVAAHIDRELAAHPEQVQIETAWRKPTDQRPGALQKHQYRELDNPSNPDAEPPCSHTRSALIVFGRQAGKSITICTDSDCPVHNPAIAERRTQDEAYTPAPVMEPAPEDETEEEAEQRKAEHAERCRLHEEERQQQEQERSVAREAEFERQQKEHEAENKRREKQHKARLAMLDRIVRGAPAIFTAGQFRTFLELLLHLAPYDLFEEAAEFLAGQDRDSEKTDDEILSEALGNCGEEKLIGFALLLLLAEHTGIPLPDQTDWLTKAESVFAPAPPQAGTKKKPARVKLSAKKAATKKKVAA